VRRRRFRLPEQVLLPREVDTDARPKDGPGRRPERQDPDEQRREQRRRQGLVLLFATVFAAGCLGALFADGGYVDLRRARTQLAEMELRVADKTAQVERLESEVVRLRDDPTALERIAREELGLSRPGEIVFLLPGRDPLTPLP